MLSLIFMLLAFSACFAASQSTNYKMTHEVLESGGGTASSSSYNLIGKSREREIDNPISASFNAFAGFLRGAYLHIVDPTPPAAITDLAAQTGVNPGEVTLTWTAVGDDGMVGTATSYIVKFSLSPIVTQTQFDIATTYAQSWAPLAAGMTETQTLTGLSQGELLYFAIEAVDDVGNKGSLSNNPSAIAKVSAYAPVRLVGVPTHEPHVFNPTVTRPGDPEPLIKIDYILTKDATIQLFIFDQTGELVWEKTYPAGTGGGNVGANEVSWNGIAEFKGRAHNGVYIYHVIAVDDGQVRSLAKGKFIVQY